jgi:regulator of replication initiation timing
MLVPKGIGPALLMPYGLDVAQGADPLPKPAEQTNTMNAKLDHLERTILELGAEIFQVKHRIDEVEKSNSQYQQIFSSLKKLLDEKGIISAEDFEEIVDLDKILKLQSSNSGSELMSILSDDLKKVVN